MEKVGPVQELGQEEGGATARCQELMKTTVLLFWVQESKKLPRLMVKVPEDILIFWLPPRPSTQKDGRTNYHDGRPALEQPPEEWNCVHVSLAAWAMGPEC